MTKATSRSRPAWPQPYPLENRPARTGPGRRLAARLLVAAGLAGLGHWTGRPAAANLVGFSDFGPANVNSGSFNGYYSSNTLFQLTDGSGGEATSGFSNSLQDVTGFVATFDYLATTASADGAALVFQTDPRGVAAIGAAGGSLGYGGSGAVTPSAAFEMNLYGGSGISYQTGGTTGGYQGTGNLNLASQNPIHVTVRYSAGSLSATLQDSTASTATFRTFAANIPTAVGGSTARVGFTAGTGGLTATQSVQNFTFTSTPATNGTYSPIAVTGFNQDVIVEAGASSASAAVTASVDNGTAKGAYTVYQKGYNAAAPTTGIAAGTTITSEADPNHTFAIQPASGANAVLLNPTNTTGALVPTQFKAYKALSFLSLSGNGSGVFDVRIIHASSAPDEIITGVGSPDWFFNTGGIAETLNGRVSTDDNSFDSVGGGNPRLYQTDVVLTNQTDPIAAIQLTLEGGSVGNTYVFGVSGVPVPEPTAAASLAGAAGLLLVRRRKRAV